VINPASLSFIAPQPRGKPNHKQPKIVFSDLVSAETRGRKGEIEFPMSLDALETYLRQQGYDQIDYAFPPDGTGGQPLATLGLRGQEPYPVKDAALWGINMMNYLQAPAFFALLHSAGLSPRREQRDGTSPLIVLGGHVWPNPLPLSDFYDVMVVGDGEDVLLQMAAILEAFPENRERLLAQIATLEGVYVPGHTDRPVKKATIDFADPRYPAGSSCLLNGVGAVLLSRGCAYDCAFCNNSLVGGPYRVKPIAQVRAHIDRLQQAGAHTIVPIAASASNYLSEGQSAHEVVEYIQKQGLAVKSMSDRPERFTPEYLRLTAQKTGKLVIAVEASPRIRQLVFRKNLREETIERAVSAGIAAGINRIQLYAILSTPAMHPGLLDFLPGGFEGEGATDLRYLAGLAMTIAERMSRAGLKKAAEKPFVLLDCMPFIPAIGTRLQKATFPSYNDYMSKISELNSLVGLRHQGLVEVSTALDERSHLLQAFLERGDARVGDALWQAWRQSLDEAMTLNDIRRAVQISGLGPVDYSTDYLERRLPYEGILEASNGQTCRPTLR
jgi:radical SAM superfamily enzyme YgiQ (UPF0313 family)